MTPSLPQPEYLGPPGSNRRWRLSKLLVYEAKLTGASPPLPLPPEQEQWLTAAQVRKRYGVSDMWLWRQLKKAGE